MVLSYLWSQSADIKASLHLAEMLLALNIHLILLFRLIEVQGRISSQKHIIMYCY